MKMVLARKLDWELMTDSGGKLNFDITGIRGRDRYENYDVIFKEFPRRRIGKSRN